MVVFVQRKFPLIFRKKYHDQNYYSKMKEKNQCRFCDKFFGNKASLRAHMQRFHLDMESKYTTCDICQRQVTKYNLNAHRATHTRGNFTCPQCDYQVKSSEVFRYHMMTEHNDTSYGTVRIHHCKYCDYNHTKSNAVNIHMQNVHGM